MTARHIYELLVGGAGIGHDTLLYHMKWWQISAAVRGYDSRSHTAWEQTRWQTWVLLSALGGKVSTPRELVRFPWEGKKSAPKENLPSQEEIEDLQRIMRELNRKQ